MTFKSTVKLSLFLSTFFPALLFLFTSFAGYAQNGSLTFTVMDSTENMTLPMTGYQLTQKNDTSVSFTGTTDAEGTAEINGIPAGSYRLRVSFISYEENIKENVKVNNGTTSLGNIYLSQSSVALDGVEISVEKEMMKTKGQGISFDATQNITQQGTSVLELLRRMPAVQVDEEGNVSLRGSNSTHILIDGRNSTLTNNLEQIPASDVQNIDIIFNPGARYDAEGAGGIINIEMKKVRKKGLQFQANAAYGSLNRFNASVSGSYKTENRTISLSYTRRHPNRRSTSSINRTNFFGDSIRSLQQEGSEQRMTYSDNIRLSVNQNISDNGKLIIENTFSSYRLSEEGENINTLFAEDNTEIGSITRNTDMERHYHNIEHYLGYDHKFGDGKKLSSGVTYSWGRSFRPQTIVSNNGVSDQLTYQKTSRPGNRQQVVMQSDYSHKIDSTFEYAFGLKSIIDNDFTSYEIQQRRNETSPYQNVYDRTFDYGSGIYAGYGEVKWQWGNWRLNTGIRSEFSRLKADFNDEEREDFDRSWLSFFPAFHASRDLSEDRQLQLSYTRKIRRPRSWWLNPFPDISDSLTLSSGNATLTPAYIDAFELSHIWQKDKMNILLTSFFRHTSGTFDYVQFVENGITTRRPANLRRSLNYGVDLIGTFKPIKKTEINASVSFYGVHIDGSNIADEYVRDGAQWLIKITPTVHLPRHFDIQLGFDYESPEQEAQGTERARYALNGGITKRWADGKWQASLSIEDVFNTKMRIEETETSLFKQKRTRKGYTRIVLAGLTYKFGKENEKKGKRKNY